MPERIQLSRRKGWRKPEGVITVSRGTEWGNPFRIGEHIDVPLQGVDPIEIDRALAVALFRRYVEDRGWQDQIRRELAGKNLACWCPLKDAEGTRVPCHADVLLEIANSEVAP